MRISDWSSDVCSSDLDLVGRHPDPDDHRVQVLTATRRAQQQVRAVVPDLRRVLEAAEHALGPAAVAALIDHLAVLTATLSRPADPPASSPRSEVSVARPPGLDRKSTRLNSSH